MIGVSTPERPEMHGNMCVCVVPAHFLTAEAIQQPRRPYHGNVVVEQHEIYTSEPHCHPGG